MQPKSLLGYPLQVNGDSMMAYNNAITFKMGVNIRDSYGVWTVNRGAAHLRFLLKTTVFVI